MKPFWIPISMIDLKEFCKVKAFHLRPNSIRARGMGCNLGWG